MLMAKVLQVSSSGYYAWKKREPSATARKRARIAEATRKYYERSSKIYGYRKVHKDIVKEEKELRCCEETVRKQMRELGLVSRVKRKFIATTDSSHKLPVAGNILNRVFSATGPDQKWVGDITYIRTREGWLYLAAVMDLWSRRIVGWSMSGRIDAELVQSALTAALAQRHPQKGLMHHSDRGVQYASDGFQGLLDVYGIECSMSRKGNCWDNAPMESFFGKLKAEWIRGHVFATHTEARQEVFSYIEVFYNRQRRHASLGYVSPADFEAGVKTRKVA